MCTVDQQMENANVKANKISQPIQNANYTIKTDISKVI